MTTTTRRFPHKTYVFHDIDPLAVAPLALLDSLCVLYELHVVAHGNAVPLAQSARMDGPPRRTILVLNSDIPSFRHTMYRAGFADQLKPNT